MLLLLSRVLLTVGLVVCCLALRAQFVQVTSNPSSLIFGVLKLESEIPLKHNFALEPEAAVLIEGQRFWSSDYDSEGVRFGLTGKKYFDLGKPHEGWYGMIYARVARIDFRDFVEEGDRRDQRDFERRRSTVGFGVGHTAAGKDGFTYGFSLGLGRHFVDEKTYETPPLGPNGEIFEADDDELFELPLDVYGRVYVGFRIYNRVGRAAKDAYEARREAEREAWRERVQGNARPAPTAAPSGGER